MKLKKPISQITPFTTLDYAEHLACIVWFSGCNMRCPYCYNIDIVLKNGTKSVDELITFLKKRKSLLDGVVLSGGECTLYRDIKPLCKTIKDLGFDIKIDTNGTNPNLLHELIVENLIDFVALDFKALKDKYFTLTHTNFFENFEKSLKILIDSDIDFEVRTTVHEDFLNEKDINKMIEFLQKIGYKKVYYLQNYLHVKTLGDLNEPKNSIEKSKIDNLLKVEFRNF